MMRQCKTCLVELPETDFYRAGNYYLSECKTCWKARVKARRLTDPSVREYDRKRAKLPHRIENATRITRAWRERNPDAAKAHRAVTYAVRSGKLTREPCEICGTRVHVHAHHKDYAKPLDVIWLCARCHHRLHALFPELEGANKAHA